MTHTQHTRCHQRTSIFIRICTTGEAPVDPPEEMAKAVRNHHKVHKAKSKKEHNKKQNEPDHLDGLNDELKTLQFNGEVSNGQEEEGADEKEKTFEEVSGEEINAADPSTDPQGLVEATEDTEAEGKTEHNLDSETSEQISQVETNEEKET